MKQLFAPPDIDKKSLTSSKSDKFFVFIVCLFLEGLLISHIYKIPHRMKIDSLCAELIYNFLRYPPSNIQNKNPSTYGDA